MASSGRGCPSDDRHRTGDAPPYLTVTFLNYLALNDVAPPAFLPIIIGIRAGRTGVAPPHPCGSVDPLTGRRHLLLRLYQRSAHLVPDFGRLSRGITMGELPTLLTTCH